MIPQRSNGTPGLFAPLDVWQAFRLGSDTNSGWHPVIMGNEDALLAFLKASNQSGFKIRTS